MRLSGLRPAKQQGMTLLEVLVATSILAVIASLAFVSLDNLVRSKQTLDEKTQTLNQANLAQFMLQTDLQMAIAGNLPLRTTANPDFVGSSQGFTLVRYRNATVPSGRGKNGSTNAGNRTAQPFNQPLIRVRWYMRNNQWFRATQNAFSPANSNQWVERPMMTLASLNCNYQSVSGVVQPNWPNSQLDQGQLPEIISCQLQDDGGQSSLIKIVPWQKMGFL